MGTHPSLDEAIALNEEVFRLCRLKEEEITEAKRYTDSIDESKVAHRLIG